MAIMTRASWSQILEVGLRDIFYAHLKKVTFYGPKILAVTDSKKKKEEYQTVGGMGIATEKTEAAAIASDNLTQGYNKILTNVSYGNGFTVSKELHDDDQYGVIKTAPKELSNSMARCVEYYCAAIFNNPTSTADAYVCADGLALLSTAHLQLDGNTYANKPSTDIDLGISALEAAYTNMMLIEDDRSNVTPYVPKILVCHPNDMFTAKKILGSSKDPDSANNTINPLEGALELIVWPYLTDTDAWFLLTAKSERVAGPSGPMLQWRQKADFEKDTDIDTRSATFNSMERFVCGTVNWRGVYGSTGG